jgi:hypothetical protein
MSAVVDWRGAAAPARQRAPRSRGAQPLIMSLGVLTLLVSGSYVALASSASGSARPQDWLRLDWASVGSVYRACAQREGLVAPSCIPRAGAGSATTVPAAITVPKAPPLYSVAVIPDQAATPAGRPAARRVATGAGSPRPVSATPASRAVVPASATHEQIVSACRTATQAAQAQGPAAVQDVSRECAALLGGPAEAHDE